jgi:hypothetical protein
MGLRESEFWDMTKAEVERYLEGAVWQMKQKAQFDYALADLIGISVSRMMSENSTFPSISEVYPLLFENKEQKEDVQEMDMQDSINRFLAFANKHNAKMKGAEN